MARFPKIDRPCPYKANLAAVMDGDFCTMCRRSVIDLDTMSDTDRALFLASCDEEVCVSYRFRPALAAAALAAAFVPAAAAAQDTTPAAVAAPDPAVAIDEEYDLIFVGGITDPKAAKLVDNPLDAALPTIPVVYEDEGPSITPAS